MQIDEFCRGFFQMETEEDLYSSRTQTADLFWDVVRYEVFSSLFHAINTPGPLRKISTSRTVRGVFTKLYSVPSAIRIMASHWVRLKRLERAEFLAFVYSRYSDENGNAIDSASDDAVHALSTMGSVRKIESQPNLLLALNINALISVVARVYRQPTRYKRYLFETARVIAGAEEKHFGFIDPDLRNVIRKTYRRHLVERRIWSEILDRSKPRVVLMTQNGIQKGLIFEARKRHIPVVECQHGASNLLHPAYTYPSNLGPGQVALLPDVLLLFSEYWIRQCRMPGTKLAAVGNNRFASAGQNSTRTGAAVFISAGPFHKYLSPLAMDLAKSMPDRAFIMKLHPSYLSDRGMIEREYRSSPNLAVVGAERRLSEIMDEASDVVVVESTAAYEALDRRIPVHFLQKGGHMRHQDLFLLPDVHLFSTAEELQKLLFRPIKAPEDIPKFFNRFDSGAFCELVQTLM